MIYVDNAGPMGRGVFATCTILPTTEIERAPAVPITAEDRKAMKAMQFGEYPFVDRETYAKRDDVRKRLPCPGFVAFGLSSIVNHSDRPNVTVNFEQDGGHWWAVMRAETIIKAGDQLLLEYPDVVEYDGHEEWSDPSDGMAYDGPRVVEGERSVRVLAEDGAFRSLPIRKLRDIRADDGRQ